MSGEGLTSLELREHHVDVIEKRSTFLPQGVSKDQALDFFETPTGERYLSHLRLADAEAPDEEIFRRALQQVMSGRDLPSLRVTDEPLIKLVPRGTDMTPHSPFFATERVIEDASNAGHRLNDRLGLPIGSEAPTYDAYVLRPRGEVEVFVSEVAPTQELDGQVRRGGQALQTLVPNRGQFHAPELIGTIDNQVAPGQTYRPLLASPSLNPAMDAPVFRPGLRPGAALGIGGIALSAYDAADTGFRIKGHQDGGNKTAAESEAIHFGGRTVGGLAGVGLGMAAGAAVGIETGPGALITAAAGGVVGAVAGDKIANYLDTRAIYNQTDRQGNDWTLDPARQDLGWRRRAPVDGTQDGIDNARKEPLRASPLLERELNFEATRHSAELVLGSPPVPRDPFSQPSREGDTPSVLAAPWVRTSDGWERTATLAYAERGLAPTRTDLASPERASDLDQAAARTIVQNAENSAPVIAARFEAAYASQGWARFGEMPEAVRNARTNTDALVASDGNTYGRQQDGGWVSRGLIVDTTASGNVREELDATRTLLATRLPSPLTIPAPLPLTADERLRDTVVGAYRNAGVELTPLQLDERARSVGETWRVQGLSPDTTALRVSASGGQAGIDSPIESLRLDADGRTYRIAATTLVTSESERSQAPKGPPPGASDVGGIEPNRSPRPQDDGQDSSRPKLANDPSHGGHAAFTRIHDFVRGTGQWSEEESMNVASGLYREQAGNPLIRRVDQVVGGLGQDGAHNVFAVYAPHGDRGPFFRAQIDGREAQHQPARENLEQAEVITQQRAQQQSMEQAHVRPTDHAAPAITR